MNRTFHTIARLAAAGLLLVLSPAAGAAEVARIFGDHMVLQRDQPLKIWGIGAEGESVMVHCAGRSAETRVDEAGLWRATLPPLAVGGPYELNVRAPSGDVTLVDVLVGEVWLASGQSNMEWAVRDSGDGDAEVAAANHPNIRLFRAPRRYADEPAHDVQGEWAVCTPDSVAEFSAVAYYFGRHVGEALDVPVGLVQVAWGASAIEAWMSAESLQSIPAMRPRLEELPALRNRFPHLVERLRAQESELQRVAAEAKSNGGPAPARLVPGYGVRQKEWPAGLYNGMIHGLVGFPIRGVLWYQGEANATRAAEYRELFPAMIGDWRARWGQGDFPFLFVQLANYRDRGSEPREHDWAELREAQTAALDLPNTAMAVAIDVGAADNIHPPNKQAVGRRLGLLAEELAYGRAVSARSPRFAELTIDGKRALVSFDHTYGALRADGSAVKGFAIAGTDGWYTWADGVIEGARVVLTSPLVADPVSVRYGWDTNPEVNLYNSAGLPAEPFRTDRAPSHR